MGLHATVDRMKRYQHWIIGPVRSNRVQFFRYFWVGGFSTVVDFSVFVFCVRVLGIHYLVAQFISYCFGFTANYVLSILWVFTKTDKFLREIAAVFAITLFGLLWTELLLYLFVDGWGFGEVWSKVPATLIVLFWNYGARRVFVYRRAPAA